MPSLLKATAAPATHSLTFPEFLDYVMRGGERGTRSYSLDHGIDETALIRYANGAVSTYERQEIQEIISRCAWAREFVVNIVKQKRKRNQTKRSAA